MNRYTRVVALTAAICASATACERAPLGSGDIFPGEGSMSVGASGASSGAGTLFGSSRSSLLSVDPASGAASVIGGMFGGTAAVFPSLAVDPLTGVLFAGGGGGSPQLHTVDPTTGQVSFVGDSGLGFAAIGGMDFAPDGTLYASVNIAGDGGTGSDHLATINTTTGAATIVGSFEECFGVPPLPADGSGSCTIEGMEAIAFDNHGVLWGSLSARGAAGSPGLYEIDPLTGEATFVRPIIGAFGVPPSGGVVSLKFACDGTLFGGTARAISGADGGRLVRINPTDGVFTFVSGATITPGQAGLGGLDFAGFCIDVHVGQLADQMQVAMLGSNLFDVTSVSVATLSFGPDGASPTHDLSDPGVFAQHLRTFNNGYQGLSLHFGESDSGLSPGDPQACLSGVTMDGRSFEGCDSLRTGPMAPTLVAYVTLQTEVARLDATRLIEKNHINAGTNPRGLAFTPDGAFAYVTSISDNTVSVIETATDLVTAVVPVGRGPHDVDVTPDGAFAYVTNGTGTTGGNSVSVIETATNTVVTTIPVGVAPHGIEVTPNGQFVYVANFSSNTVSVISTASNSVVATIPVGSTVPDHAPVDVVITPDGAFVYVTKAGSNTGTISVIATATNTVTLTVPLNTRPSRLAIKPDGSEVYIAGGTVPQSFGDVIVLETATNTVAATIPLGRAVASDIAVTPDGTSLYAVFGFSLNFGEVRVIDTGTRSVVRTASLSKAAGRIEFP